MSIAEKFEIIADEVYEKGKQSEYDRFWDAYQQNGTRTTYTFAFAGFAWTDETYNPKYPIVIASGNQIFQNTQITDTKVDIDFSKHNSTNRTRVFGYASNLVRIKKVIVNENTIFTDWFINDKKLEYVTFEGTIANNLDMKDCVLLSENSVRNIISHLSDTTTGKTLTLSQTAIDTNFSLEDDGVTSQFVALAATKPNWTISLV